MPDDCDLPQLDPEAWRAAYDVLAVIRHDRERERHLTTAQHEEDARLLRDKGEAL